MTTSSWKALAAAMPLALIAAALIALAVSVSGGGEAPRIAAGPGPTATPTPKPNALAQVIGASTDLIDGPMSRGRLGDVLLANDKVQVVIQQPQRNLLSVGQYGGQIIDADLVRQGPDPERDSFEEWAVGINLENTCHYTSVSIINDGANGQPAVVRATGVDDLLDFINPSSQVAGFGFPFPAAFDDANLLDFTCTTDYSIGLKDRYVTVDTTFTNTGATQISTFMTEFMNGSGQLETFLPGYGFGEPLVTATCALCNFIAWQGYGNGEGVTYGYVHNIPGSTSFNTNGVTIPLVGESAALALIGAALPNIIIPPSGGQVTLTRYFAVGEDVGDIVDIRNQITGLTTGTISGTVTRNSLPVEDADVTVFGAFADGPGSDKNVVAHYQTDALGQYQGTLPLGSYTVKVHLDGHMPASPDPASVTITASPSVHDFTIPVSGRIKVTLVDENNLPIAGKVSIVGIDQYKDPENTQLFLGQINNRTGVFGDVTFDPLTFGLAKVLFMDETGDTGEVFLEPGDYQVVVSHGQEYSIFEQNVTLTSGNLEIVTAQIARVIDTSGFVSGDFHVHMIDSPDSAVSKEERIVTMLAEGVDFFTTTDHEHRTDLTSQIASLGVGGLISVAVGAETTSPDYGHFNSWPMTIDPTKVNNGAIDWAGAAPDGMDFPSFGNYTLSPAQIFAALLADPGTDTVQINHMDSFFGPGGLAVDTAYIPPRDFADNADRRLDPGIANLFDSSFTALEVWQGTDRNDILNRFIGRNMGDWFNMINQGIIRSGIAVSDTHQTANVPSGFPHTSLASSTDDPSALGAIADALSGNVNAGRNIGTNGPFIKVTSSAASTGQNGGLALGLPTLISTTNGSAQITVDIESPLWAPFDRVEYYVNTVPTPDDTDDDPTTPPFWRVATMPTVQTAPADFTINAVNDFPSIPGASHLEAATSLTLNGLTQDTWVVVLVRGMDGTSEPLFPVIPNDLCQVMNVPVCPESNDTLTNLTDGNLGELGVNATAFANPLFIDVNGNATYDVTPVDSDRDGCLNNDELLGKANAGQGGGRSPSSFWDFMDVWTGNPFIRNKIANSADIAAVVARFGANDTGPGAFNRDSDPLSSPTIAITPSGSRVNYHPIYDRNGSIIGQNAWNLKPPSGVINAQEIANVVAQFGHNCN